MGKSIIWNVTKIPSERKCLIQLDEIIINDNHIYTPANFFFMSERGGKKCLHLQFLFFWVSKSDHINLLHFILHRNSITFYYIDSLSSYKGKRTSWNLFFIRSVYFILEKKYIRKSTFENFCEFDLQGKYKIPGKIIS